jgi:hypothetical protein
MKATTRSAGRDRLVTMKPAVYPNRFFAVDGGLISYGIDNIDMYRQAAAYVDRILKGSKVAELPVQAPVGGPVGPSSCCPLSCTIRAPCRRVMRAAGQRATAAR